MAPPKSRRTLEQYQADSWLILWLRGARFGRARLRRASRARAADGQAIHPQCRLADADRHALTVLAAGADTVIKPKILANHRDFGQRVRSVANQGGTFDRRPDFAVF